MGAGKSEDKKNQHKIQRILISGIALILAAVIASAALIYRALSSGPAEEAGTGGEGNLVVDEGNLDVIEDQLARKVQEGMFEVNMNTVWHFEEGERTSDNAYVANSASNSYAFTFEVLLDGTESVYYSTLVPVGRQLKELELDKALPAGEHEAVCMYHLWEEDGTENSSVGVNVTLSVD